MEENLNESKKTERKGISRRGFMQLMGAGALATTLYDVRKPAGAGAADRADVVQKGEMVHVRLLVNGKRHRYKVEPRWTLLDVLREKMGLTGPKLGCGRGECGACTVLIDGRPRYACLTLALEAEGKEITTVEGLMKGDELCPVQKAFWENDAMQCGYCIPGQIVAAEGLLRANPNPSLDEIRRGMSGNLCRCGSYAHIFKAVEQAAKLRK
ncbi:MAG: (2Fe-2S)-binding protein [Deltaproteobacteria bacterium]|nr:(2Fe-2S)-binding protein [Deltaproteobacteria bacterium]